MNDAPTVFLSSTFKDYYGGGLVDVPLRKKILENRVGLPVRIWAYEHDWRGLDFDPDADTIVDRCFDGIKNCDLFAFLLTGRHGSGVGYFEQSAQASYLELELFAAAVLRKPVLVLHERGRVPEDALSAAMGMLSRSADTALYLVGDQDELFRSFRTVCDALARGLQRKVNAGALPDWLSRQRSRAHGDEDLAAPALQFLGGDLRAERGATHNPDLARRLLDEVGSGRRTKGGVAQLLPHGAALFRIWTAMRELMVRDGERMTPEVAMLWDRALGLWAGKASWFGLHGHTVMGPYAALNTQTRLRTTFASVPAFRDGRDVREPLGARASALHSIAQTVETWERKLFHFDQAILAATQAMQRDTNATQGILSIRGLALLRSGLLARPWRFWDGERDLAESLKIRERAGLTPASIGEAMVDHGFARILTGRIFAGFAEMRSGVELLRTDSSANGLAFLARGLRKLEQGAWLTGRRRAARRAYAERMSLASRIEAMDQARDVRLF